MTTYHDEVQLLGYGESDSGGCWIKFRILPEDMETFRGLKGERFACALQLIDNDEQPVSSADCGDARKDSSVVNDLPQSADQKGPHGKYVRDLMMSGIFNKHEVLEHIGTDADFQTYVREQPSCISKQGPCVYAHVRRANNSGTGIKPKYSGVPLTQEEHQIQHNNGERVLLNVSIVNPEGPWMVDDAKAWFDARAERYRRDYATIALAYDLWGYTSRAQVPPQEWRDWFKSIDVKLPLQLGGSDD